MASLTVIQNERLTDFFLKKVCLYHALHKLSND